MTDLYSPPAPATSPADESSVSTLDLVAQIAELRDRITDLEDRLEEPGLIRLYDEAKAAGGDAIPFEQMLAEAGYRIP